MFNQNRPWVALAVPTFLCPSDRGTKIVEERGPGNYVACSGSIPDADESLADGVFHVNSDTRFRDVTDGTSNTVFFSESLLGSGDAPTTAGPIDPATTFVSLGTADTLNPATCAAATTFKTDRGKSWADGAYPNGLFNAVLPPNSDTPDCIRHSNPGYKAARSRHTGGVTVALGDGAVRLVSDTISLNFWQSLATRSGGELVGEF